MELTKDEVVIEKKAEEIEMRKASVKDVLNLSPNQEVVLEYLCKEGERTSKDISRDLEMSLNHITKLLSTLNKKKYIDIKKKSGESKTYSIKMEVARQMVTK